MNAEWINRKEPLTDAERKLVEDNRGLVGDVIRREFRSYVRKVAAVGGEKGREYEELFTYGDLFGAGCFGIIIAAGKWDPSKGPWPMFCEIWIKNRIHLFIDKCWSTIRLPKGIKQGKRRETLAPEDRERYRLAKDLRPIETATGALAKEGMDREARRREALAVIYSARPRTRIERLGRVIALKLAGLDGGDSGYDDPARVEEAALATGIAPATARTALAKFIRRIKGDLWRAGKLGRKA